MLRLPGGWRLSILAERRRRFGRFYVEVRLICYRLNA